MGLETGDFIDDLVDTNPLGTDPVSEGDDHLTLIKRAIVNAFKGDAATVSLLSNALDVALATTANGIQVGMPGVVGRVQVDDNNDVPAATLDAAAGGVSLNALVEDVTLALNGTPTGGGGVPVFTGDPNGAAELMFIGIAALLTTAFGITVHGQGTGAASITVNNDDGLIFTLQANAASAVQLIAKRDGQDIQLRATDSGSIERPVVSGDPDAATALYFAGIGVWSTLSDGFTLTQNATVRTGSGSPEGVVTANPGSLYLDVVSGSGTPLWCKNFSGGNTGWLRVDTSAP